MRSCDTRWKVKAESKGGFKAGEVTFCSSGAGGAMTQAAAI